jgi:amino acid adenylation domain-containing protein
MSGGTAVTDTTPFPLTDMQAAYLVGKSRLIELGGRQNYYIELDAVGIDPEPAEEALNRLVARQEHLRTVMLDTGEQRVMDPAEVPRLRINVVDLIGRPVDVVHDSLRRTRSLMCERSALDPTDWPLFRVAISRIRRHRVRIHLQLNLILLDGPSLRHCIEEWLELYSDPDAVLAPVPYTFRDWRLALADFEAGPEFAKQWAYWEPRLDGLPPAPQLPLARQLAAIEQVSFTGRRSFLTKSQWDTLRANYRKHHVLGTTALLHVYAETLGLWACDPHFCLNVVHQNLAAKPPRMREVVGQRSATLPLEVDLREGGFWERARRLQRRLFLDMENGAVTAVRVSRELAVRSGWTQRASYPYVFTSNQGPGWDTAILRRPAFHLLERIQHTPQVLVDDQLRDAPDGGVSSMLDFVEEAFPAGLPDAVVAAYRRLLEALSRPDGAECDPDPLAPEYRALIGDVNQTAAPPPPGRLEDGFLERAADDPGAVAVLAADRALDYGELEARSRAVAHWLRSAGIGRGDVVPVVMAKGWEQVVAVLAVLRSGAAYCPLDVALPNKRLAELIVDCDATVVLTQSHSRPVLDLSRWPALDVDLAEPSAEPLPSSGGDASDIAYIIHTSGSTGRPKGVVIDHRAALNTITDVNERIGLNPADRVFGISQLSFDLSVWDIFGSLRAGAALVLPRATPEADPIGWAAAAAKYGVTVWNSVPALAEMLVEVGEQRLDLGRAPVRAFLVSGDWIPVTLPDRMRGLWPQVQIMAMGGATEAAIWSNLFEVGDVDPQWRSIPYGRPLTNQVMRVLDHRFDIRAVWAVGRIYISGAGLARGYWRDEAKTAERFVFDPRSGERLYWTGDLGRYLPDGTIEFLGREDRQVKIQGFRVEPGEIEAALRQHQMVRECLVCVDEAPGGGTRLSAMVVPGDGGLADSGDFLAHLRSQVPYYMVPGRLRVVERLPLTANGKVDVARALAAFAETDPGAALADIGDSPVTKQLAEIWAELLAVQAVGPDDDFFALGGNSLVALRMINRVRTAFGVDLPLGQVFEAPTVRRLAVRVEHGDRAAGCGVELSAGPGRRLFLFHVTGGSIARYAALAESWPGPVTAFQSRALAGSGPDVFAPDFETMASAYRQELQEIQPAGPYLLGGWSSGGLLAWEVARQLAERGQASRVVMIDSEVRELIPPADERERHLAFIVSLAQGTPPEQVVAAVSAAGDADLAEAAHGACVAHGLLPAEIGLDEYLRLKRMLEHELDLLAGYRPGPLNQPSLLFVATEETDRADPVPAFRELNPGLVAEPLTGDHFSISARFPEVAGRVSRWLSAG